MGEIIRSRGLATAVGTADASGRLTRSYCASACVLLYAGGTPRYGVEGSALGVHRFTATLPSHDPVADAQRTTGMVLSYMTKMGVSSAVVEAMSATRDVRWLSPTEALTMNLTTGPIGKRGGASPLILIFHYIGSYRTKCGKKTAPRAFFNPFGCRIRLCRDAALHPHSQETMP